MPYRHAHWWLLALFPLIAVAFWPNYFGQLGGAPFALHAHGISATLWLLLLTVQSWSIHARRADWHRATGLATFIALPLFAAAGPLALWSMIELYASNADPFHATYGARLAICDMIAGPTVIGLVVYAFAQRRRARAHAAGMLATAITVLPPVLGRLIQRVPLIPAEGGFGMAETELSFYVAWGVSLVIALALARGPARFAFGIAILSTLGQLIAFATVGRTTAWERAVVELVTLPVIPAALAAGVGAFGLLWWAWRREPWRGANGGGIAAAA